MKYFCVVEDDELERKGGGGLVKVRVKIRVEEEVLVEEEEVLVEDASRCLCCFFFLFFLLVFWFCWSFVEVEVDD